MYFYSLTENINKSIMGGLKKVIRIVDDSSKILFVFYICVADAMIAG
jgi:hypothetical protein